MIYDLCLLLFDDTVSPCHSAKFLGVEIDYRLSFKSHFEDKVKKRKSRLNLFKMLKRGGVNNATLIRLFKTFVRPLFEYGCMATISASKDNVQKFQKVQNEFLRICLSLPKYIRTDLLHKSAGLDLIGSG